MTEVAQQRIPLSLARQIAARVRAALLPFCEIVEVAGSIRRGSEFVGDVDLVVIPKAGFLGDFYEAVGQLGRVEKSGRQYVLVTIPDGTQLDIWFAREASCDLAGVVPCNFGAVLLTRTGSREHNIAIVARAKRLGLRYHPQEGVMDSWNRVIASKNEQVIFAALELEFVAPRDRVDASKWVVLKREVRAA